MVSSGMTFIPSFIKIRLNLLETVPHVQTDKSNDSYYKPIYLIKSGKCVYWGSEGIAPRILWPRH
jgi:hypothetical protein